MNPPVKDCRGDDEDAEECELDGETDDGDCLACVHGAKSSAGHYAAAWRFCVSLKLEIKWRRRCIPAACMTNATTSPITNIKVNHLMGTMLRASASRYRINRPRVMYIDAA